MGCTTHALYDTVRIAHSHHRAHSLSIVLSLFATRRLAGAIWAGPKRVNYYYIFPGVLTHSLYSMKISEAPDDVLLTLLQMVR